MKENRPQKEETEESHDEPKTVYELMRYATKSILKRIKASRLFAKFFMNSLVILMYTSTYLVSGYTYECVNSSPICIK